LSNIIVVVLVLVLVVLHYYASNSILALVSVLDDATTAIR